MKKYILLVGVVIWSVLVGFGQAHQSAIYQDGKCQESKCLSNLCEIEEILKKFNDPNVVGQGNEVVVNIMIYSQDCHLTVQNGQIIGPEVAIQNCTGQTSPQSCIWGGQGVDYLLVFEPGNFFIYDSNGEKYDPPTKLYTAFGSAVTTYEAGQYTFNSKLECTIREVLDKIDDKENLGFYDWTSGIGCESFNSIPFVNLPKAHYDEEHQKFIPQILEKKLVSNHCTQIVIKNDWQVAHPSFDEGKDALIQKFGSNFLVFDFEWDKEPSADRRLTKVEVIPVIENPKAACFPQFSTFSHVDYRRIEDVLVENSIGVADHSKAIARGAQFVLELLEASDNENDPKQINPDCKGCGSAEWDPNSFVHCITIPDHLIQDLTDIEASRQDDPTGALGDLMDFAGFNAKIKSQMTETITRSSRVSTATQWGADMCTKFISSVSGGGLNSTFGHAQTQFSKYTIKYPKPNSSNNVEQKTQLADCDYVLWFHVDLTSKTICFNIVFKPAGLIKAKEFGEAQLNATLNILKHYKPSEGNNTFFDDEHHNRGCGPFSDDANADRFGLREGWSNDDLNWINMSTEIAGILKETVKTPDKPKIPDHVWKVDGKSMYDMPGALIGLFNPVLQENPISGLYGIMEAVTALGDSPQKRTELKEAVSSPYQTGVKLLNGMYNKVGEKLDPNLPKEEFQYNVVELSTATLIAAATGYGMYKLIKSKSAKKAADDVAEIVDEFSEELVQKINSLGDPALIQKFHDDLFLMGGKSKIPDFNANPKMIDAWKEMNSIDHGIKRNLDFLDKFSKLSSTQQGKLKIYMSNQKYFTDANGVNYKGQINYDATKNITDVGRITIRYDKDGFPDFTARCPRPTETYVYRDLDLKGTTNDFTKANKRLAQRYGFEPPFPKDAQKKYLTLENNDFRWTPNQLNFYKLENGEWIKQTWHHHQDGTTLFPLDTRIHNVNVPNASSGFPHSGGDKLIQDDLKGFFDSPTFN